MTEKVNRREFQQLAALSLGCGPALIGICDEAEAAPAAGAAACNFQSSFMTWDLPYRPDPRPYARHNIPLGNKARIQLESVIDVVSSDKHQQFVLIAACRTEWVYAKDRLFQIPSREYRNIYSLTQQRGMGRAIQHDGGRSSARSIDDYRSLKIEIERFSSSRELKTPAEINDATDENVPLVARTEIRHPDRDLRYVLEYPIKTMNFRPENGSFQVDTGPLLVPDFKVESEKVIETFEMAHIAYNRLDRAEFILRRPTPIVDDDGKELCRVLHYSEPHEYPATTQILAGDRA